MLSGEITKLKNKQNMSGLLDLYEHNTQQLNAIHLANIYGALAKEVRGSDNVEKLKNDDKFKNMLESTIDKLQNTPNHFGVRAIATITHSLGKLKISDQIFFNEIVRLRERIAEEGEPQALSNIVWACATVGHESAELFEAVAGQHKLIAGTGDVQHLSNITWAFAKLDCKAEALFGTVAGQHERIAKEGKVQEWSNICWAFAKLECKANADELFHSVAAQHKRIAKNGKVQELSNICWAFAKLECNADAEALFRAVAAQYERITGSGNVQNLSNIVWACATLGYKSEELLKAVAAQHERIAKEGNLQALSNIVWACATLGYKSEELLKAVASQHKRISKEGNLQALSNIVWSCSTLGYKSEELLEAVLAQHGRIAKSDKVQGMSNICWAFATAGHEAKNLFKAVAAQRERIARDGNEQNVTNTLWSFAIAGYLDEGRDLVEKLWNWACDGRLQLNDEDLSQLALFYAAAQIEEPNLNLEPPPESLLGQIEAALAKSDVTVSQNHQEVSDTLTEINIDHKMEVSPFEGSNVTFNTSTMLNIDIVISKNDNKNIAIEFNGPFHYLQSNGPDVENGTTKFKRRLLEKLNFTVVSIHWDDWRKAREANTHKEFLQNLLLD